MTNSTLRQRQKLGKLATARDHGPVSATWGSVSEVGATSSTPSLAFIEGLGKAALGGSADDERASGVGRISISSTNALAHLGSPVSIIGLHTPR